MLDQKIRERPSTGVPARPRSYRGLISVVVALALAMVGFGVWALYESGRADDLSADLATAELQITALEAEVGAQARIVSVVEHLQRIGSWTYPVTEAASVLGVSESLQRIGSWVTAEPQAAYMPAVSESLLRIGSWTAGEPGYVPGVSESLQRIGSWTAGDFDALEGLLRVGDWAYRAETAR